MIIDGFIFFNELDLLEIRLNELNSVVDFFVLVESTKTFSNQEKPLYFEENKKRFSNFSHKIKHVIVDDMPDGDNPWLRERHQRKMVIDRGFEGFDKNAVGMISDADEIPSADVVSNAIPTLCKTVQPILVYHFFCYFYANRALHKDGKFASWGGTRIAPVYSWQGKTGREEMSNHLFGGWHMTYLGGLENIKKKLNSYSHYKDLDHLYITDEIIQKSIEEGFTVRENIQGFKTFSGSIDLPEQYYPRYLRENKEKFSHLIFHKEKTV